MFGAVMRMERKKANHGRSPTQLRKHEKKSTGLSFGNVHPRYNLDLPARPDALTYSGGVARSTGVGRGHRSNKSNAGKRVAIIQRMRNNVVQRCESDQCRTAWGAPHTKANVAHNNAIEKELDEAYSSGATDIRKNKVQCDAQGNRVFSNGSYTRPDASYVDKNGIRHNTNYVSNKNNPRELEREKRAYQAMKDADPNAINNLVTDY